MQQSGTARERGSPYKRPSCQGHLQQLLLLLVPSPKAPRLPPGSRDRRATREARKGRGHLSRSGMPRGDARRLSDAEMRAPASKSTPAHSRGARRRRFRFHLRPRCHPRRDVRKRRRPEPLPLFKNRSRGFVPQARYDLLPTISLNAATSRRMKLSRRRSRLPCRPTANAGRRIPLRPHSRFPL